MSRMCRNCLKPWPARAEQVLLRHPAVLERERPRVGRVPAHLAVRLALLVAGRAVLDDQVGDLAVAGAGGDRDVAGDVGAGVGDELLGAVDRPTRRCRGSARVRTLPASEPASGSVSPNAPELAARAQVGHQPLLLLLGAEQVDGLGAERGVRAHRDRDAGVHARELLDGQRVGQRVAARAAVLLGERDPHQAEVAELGDDLVREALLAVELLGDRRDLALGEVAHGAPDQLVVVGEVEVHPAIVAGPRLT